VVADFPRLTGNLPITMPPQVRFLARLTNLMPLSQCVASRSLPKLSQNQASTSRESLGHISCFGSVWQDEVADSSLREGLPTADRAATDLQTVAR
jgi:hypothetical protein